VGWVAIRLANVYSMTQLLLRVQKPLSFNITVTVPAPEQYGDSFVKAWAVEGTV